MVAGSGLKVQSTTMVKSHYALFFPFLFLCVSLPNTFMMQPHKQLKIIGYIEFIQLNFYLRYEITIR